MTKLCNTCEYLKFCARSGIEDVGCDRYKKDTTTNEEWLRNATTEQLAECISDITCNCWGCKRIYVEDCPNYARYKACFCDKKDVLEWLKQPHTFE